MKDRLKGGLENSEMVYGGEREIVLILKDLSRQRFGGSRWERWHLKEVLHVQYVIGCVEACDREKGTERLPLALCCYWTAEVAGERRGLSDRSGGVIWVIGR